MCNAVRQLAPLTLQFLTSSTAANPLCFSSWVFVFHFTQKQLGLERALLLQHYIHLSAVEAGKHVKMLGVVMLISE